MTVRALGGLAAPVIALLPACFHPTFDHPACPDHVCPTGWTCNPVTEICDPADGGGPPDASVDAPSGSGGADARTCFGSGLVTICLASAPSGTRTINQGFFDTSADANCTEVVPAGNTAVSDMCVIAGTTIIVPVSVNAVYTGPRPLVVIATDTLTVDGILDVSSRTGTSARRGAGANSGTCNAPTAAGDDTGGGGGGAGGSFGTRGGAGGNGDLDNNGSPAGMALGGIAGAAQLPPGKLRGGCPGGEGGAGPPQQRAAGGAGGGALYLIAGTLLSIDGNVYASGGGGDANSDATGSGQGGGGGGSGGMIGLDAPAIAVTGRVVANGGAGGGGGATNTGGSRGGEGTTLNWSSRAAAGAGSTGSAGNGGTGGAGTAVGQTGNVDGGDSNVGGGGGAGGVGVILVYGALMGGTMISPAATRH